MPTLARTLLLLRTVQYLKLRQWVFRFWYLLYRPSADTAAAPERRLLGSWHTPPVKADSWRAPGVFRFLNVEQDYSHKVNWNDPGCEKLWIYNLHYFDYLNSRELLDKPDIASELMDHWIKANPPGSGCGWDSYPISLRIVNWIKWAIHTGQPVVSQDHSMAVQMRWLSGKVEHHILANHLFANAKTLVFAGLYFSGVEADQWLKRGISLINAELNEQVLADGGHYERSPMYHAIILEDVLDLLNYATVTSRNNETRSPDLTGSPVGTGPLIPAATLELWRTKANAMLSWYSAMVHPDGQMPFFNDAAMRIAPTLEVLQEYAARLGIAVYEAPSHASSSHILETSGYAILQAGSMRVIADVGPVGPDYQPGHTHADTLSFELSLASERVLVNSGTSTYKMGAQRQFERSTRAHNTVEINDKNSSEVWAGFRVGRRASPLEVNFQTTRQVVSLQAAHDGYRRLKPPLTHRREWHLNDVRLVVTDTLDGSWSKAIGRLYLHPDITLGNDGTIITRSGAVLHWELSGAKSLTKPALWYSEFGKALENRCIEYEFESSKVTFTLSLPT